eukprot:7610461-Pyramimonas_sp.AAC.1
MLHFAHLPSLAMMRKLNAQLPHCLHHENGCARPMTRKCAMRVRAEENPSARKAFLNWLGKQSYPTLARRRGSPQLQTS